MQDAHELYGEAMLDVKRRFRLCDRLLDAEKPFALSSDHDDELLCLQLRKILELIAFGGIIADEERYAALRAESKNNPDYWRDWKANGILDRLATITPHYLPISLGVMSRHEDGSVHFQRGADVAQLDRLKAIYTMASQPLHVRNPFGPISEPSFLPSDLREFVAKELAYLKGSLWNHVKVGLGYDGTTDSPRTPSSPDDAWLVQFGDANEDAIHVQLAKGIASPVESGERMGFTAVESGRELKTGKESG